MKFLQGSSLFGVLYVARKSYLPTSKKSSLVLFLVVFLMHVLLVFYMLKYGVKVREALVVEAQVNLMLLKPENNSAPFSDLPINPDERSVILLEVVIPEIEIKELDLGVSDFNDTYELHNKNSDKYKDVFDPKLRKKLQALPPQVKKKPKIQYLGVGITLEDIGNGMCIYGDALHKTGRKVKCGLDQGEQMMLNVEQALADPLGIK